jgi:hypothetical protein
MVLNVMNNAANRAKNAGADCALQGKQKENNK